LTSVSAPSAVSLLRQQIRDSRQFLEDTVRDVTPEQASRIPEGKALPIAAHYAHLIVGQDLPLHGMLLGRAPLIASSWAGRAGFAGGPPPFGPNAPWGEWARTTKFDLSALRQYAEAVYAASEEYLAALDDEGVNRPVDLSAVGGGMQTVGWLLTAAFIVNVNMHCGEISCLKGLEGYKGYAA